MKSALAAAVLVIAAIVIFSVFGHLLFEAALIAAGFAMGEIHGRTRRKGIAAPVARAPLPGGRTRRRLR